MGKIELTYAEIEKLQHILRSYSPMTSQEKDQLQKLTYKLIGIRAQLEYSKTK
jgi:hypothetical protein